MEQELKCNLLLPLEEMSLRIVVTLPFSSSNVLEKVSQVRLLDSTNVENVTEWEERVEDVVQDKVSELGLPNELAKRAKDLVRPIGSELRRWILSHDSRRNPLVDRPLPGSTKLCWTSVGKIDDRKTAENLVHSDLISLERRYEMACQYCLEESIRRLWTVLPEEKKARYSIENTDCSRLAVVWPHILSGELSSLNHLLRKRGRVLTSFNQWGFEYSAVESCSKSATKYFFEKLTIPAREDSLVRAAHALLVYRHNDPLLGITLRPLPIIYYEKKYFEVIHYLLTLMSPEERRQAVRKHPSNVLGIFLYWPLQDLFVENASLAFTFFHPRYLPPYQMLLERLNERFYYLGQCFPKLFRELFIQSPPELKKSFANSYRYIDFFPATDFLSLFVDSEDSESIEVVFRNLGEADRRRIVFHPDFRQLSFQSTNQGRWHMVELCLREAALSDKDKRKWKTRFWNFHGDVLWREDRNYDGFFEFFDIPEEERDLKRKFDELSDDYSSE